jgi:hypothetical protein
MQQLHINIYVTSILLALYSDTIKLNINNYLNEDSCMH